MGATNWTKTTAPAWYTSLNMHTLCPNEHVPVSMSDTNCDTGCEQHRPQSISKRLVHFG